MGTNLAGRREYPGNAIEAGVARLSRPPSVPVGLPADLTESLERMTTTDPDARTPAAQAARELHDAATKSDSR